MYRSYLSILIWSDTGADIVQWLMKNLSIEDPGMFLKWESRVYSAEWFLKMPQPPMIAEQQDLFIKSMHAI